MSAPVRRPASTNCFGTDGRRIGGRSGYRLKRRVAPLKPFHVTDLPGGDIAVTVECPHRLEPQLTVGIGREAADNRVLHDSLDALEPQRRLEQGLQAHVAELEKVPGPTARYK